MVVVTISGPSGSGKSTVTKILAEKLKLPIHSAGRFFREKAKEKNMDIKDFMKVAPNDLHREADESIDFESKKGNVVIEGRLSGVMASVADLRIYVTASLEVRAKRIMDRGLSFEDAKVRIGDRDITDRSNYLKIYDIDTDNLKVYDLVINAEHFSAENVAEIIELALKLSSKL
ncbi:MAG: AAA family ATPase [Candidatus Altiarchaeota archaeon]|nr:AAA family ATPase [Candidatus Altiarchaeota archaeon]